MRSILSNRLLIGLLILVICAVAGFYLLQKQQPKEPIIIYKPTIVEKPVAPKPPPPGETAETGHWHGDEWHADPHETHDPPAVSVGQSYIPEGAAVSPNFPPVDPNEDPVEAAYKRLEYIKNNPYAWGGVHSERATELIAELMPASLPIDHADSETREVQIDELCQLNDPRAAEALIAIMCDGGTMGRVMFDTLEAIGPPAVPYILPYLFREDRKGGAWIPVNFAVFDVLGHIGVKYRADLGGILDHIIIPKLQEIAADENNERYYHVTVGDAKAVLSVFGR